MEFHEANIYIIMFYDTLYRFQVRLMENPGLLELEVSNECWSICTSHHPDELQAPFISVFIYSKIKSCAGCGTRSLLVLDPSKLVVLYMDCFISKLVCCSVLCYVIHYVDVIGNEGEFVLYIIKSCKNCIMELAASCLSSFLSANPAITFGQNINCVYHAYTTTTTDNLYIRASLSNF